MDWGLMRGVNDTNLRINISHKKGIGLCELCKILNHEDTMGTKKHQALSVT